MNASRAEYCRQRAVPRIVPVSAAGQHVYWAV